MTFGFRSYLSTTVLLAGLTFICEPVAQAQDASGPTTPSVETEAVAEQQTTTGLRGDRTWLYGVRGGMYAAGGQGFFGGGVVVPLSEGFSFNPNGEWLFVRDIDRMFTVNADLHYGLPLEGRVMSWVGTGIGVRHFAKGGGWPPEHSLGLNLIGGTGFRRADGWIPYVQGKVFLAGDTLFANTAEFVLSAGLRF